MDQKDEFSLRLRRSSVLLRHPLALAQLVLTLERVWPAFFRVFIGLAVTAGFTVMGGWQILSPLAHILLLGGAGALILCLLVQDIRMLEWPQRIEALKRLQSDNGLQHQPLQSLEDTPFSGSSALWQAHRAACRQRVTRLEIKPPRATIDQRDPYCMRYLALFGVILCAIMAGPDIGKNAAMIKPRPLFAVAPYAATLWIEAPDYTGLAPITLLNTETGLHTATSARRRGPSSGSGPGTSEVDPDGAELAMTVPVNSMLEIRVAAAPGWPWQRPVVTLQNRHNRERYRFGGNNMEAEPRGQISHPMTEDTLIRARIGGKTYDWFITVLEDRPPEIRLDRPITATEANKLEIIAELADDYGVVRGLAQVKLLTDQAQQLDAPAPDPMVTDEAIELPLPFIQGKAGLRSQLLDLTRHPWAGLDVALSIGGCDGAGQCRFTEAQRLTLPQKPFYNDLARTVIAERQTLAIAPQSRARTRDTLAALTASPALFFDDPREYLLLRTAFWQVAAPPNTSRPDTQLVDEFWTLALHLEDDVVALARKALDEAQAALRDAVNEGAGAATLARLTQDLRQKINAYLEALAQSGQIAPAQEAGQNADIGDLDELLDQINDLAGASATEAAARLLSELNQLLENIQLSEGTANSGQGSDTRRRGDGAVEAAGDLINQQREIADKTFDAARVQYGLEGGGSDISDASGAQLGAAQSALATEAARFAKGLAQFAEPAASQAGANATRTDREPGNPPDSENPANLYELDNPASPAAKFAQQQARFTGEAISALESATRQMQEATRFLEDENFAAASQAQDGAIEALREGAVALSKAGSAGKEAQNAAQGTKRDANGDLNSGAQQGPQNTDGEASGGQLRDPLGRAYIPDPNAQDILPDFSDPTRARALIDLIRARLTSGSLPEEERDYLQRLLDRFAPAP